MSAKKSRVFSQTDWTCSCPKATLCCGASVLVQPARARTTCCSLSLTLSASPRRSYSSTPAPSHFLVSVSQGAVAFRVRINVIKRLVGDKHPVLLFWCRLRHCRLGCPPHPIPDCAEDLKDEVFASNYLVKLKHFCVSSPLHRLFISTGSVFCPSSSPPLSPSSPPPFDVTSVPLNKSIFPPCCSCVSSWGPWRPFIFGKH